MNVLPLFNIFSTCATIGISKNNTGNVPWKFTIARPYIYTIYNVYYKNLNATHFFCLTSPKNLIESKRLNALAEERVNSRSLRPARQAAEKVCVACSIWCHVCSNVRRLPEEATHGVYSWVLKTAELIGVGTGQRHGGPKLIQETPAVL